MSGFHLWPAASRKRPGQSFVFVKAVTVPNQAMTLQDVLKRFVRREPVAIEKQGIYEERFGDLEKLSHADPVIQQEKVAEWKEVTNQRFKAYKDSEEKKAQKKKEEFDAAVRAQIEREKGGVDPSKIPPSGA